MKVLIIVWSLAATVLAEAPLSKSYLPPSPSNRNSGFSGYPASPQGSVPEVVAARSLLAPGFGQGGGHGLGGGGRHGLGGAGGHGYTRDGSTSQFNHGNFGGNAGFSSGQGYDESAQAVNRNLLEELNQEPANYNFEYMVNDAEEGTDFGHHEERVDESAHGEYHVVLPDGRKQTVEYEADEKGYKPRISYEESELALGGAGYDANAQNTEHHNGGHHHGNNNHGNSHHSNGNHHANGASSNGY